jgi:ethanolamine ammonia-lyase small subunit
MNDDQLVIHNPWHALRRFTNARIALGRAGDSLPTGEMLAFQLDHARARDAVHEPFDSDRLAVQLRLQGFEVIQLHSAASDRNIYLKRPDLGRRLSEASRKVLEERAAQSDETYDAAFVIADGLSALAVHLHAVSLFTLTAAALQGVGWRIAPVVIANQGRVALGDEIGQLLRATQVAMLIGERPGLSVADSLGVYLTYAPQPGRTDADRNCISNIHPHGLSYVAAQQTLVYLMSEARRQKLTGVALKDDRAERDSTAHLIE